ncbi:WG repeat-containing protein [Flagellimonas lutaonensis]|uniref:KWG Leptospira repeat protein n=1 Tax=Flagellimonas lutaonensis TaxID=516051 RepID=A0A0D5YPU3_9FLAO|nr:WG repeat-containing protein [Allomuricauda lutaonensis]AKA34247.1 KWG Leptospira repeat protein [Allomuricauda lutaonensis]
MKQYFAFLALVVLPFFVFSQTLKTINKPTIKGLDEVAPFSEDLAAVRKGNQWGFIDKTGQLVIDFRSDLVWSKNADPKRKDVKGIRYPQFKNGRCMIQEIKDEDIPYYGFIDTEGQIAIEPEYINLTEFDDGRAVGIFCRRTYRGKNNFQLNIYEYTFTEAVLNTEGEIIWPIEDREGILMKKGRYEMPELRATLISPDLLAVKDTTNDWEIRNINSQNQKP